jgi:uncharacterized membrane protein YbhN (UPF0104 family)
MASDLDLPLVPIPLRPLRDRIRTPAPGSRRALQVMAAALVVAVLTVEAVVIEPHLKSSLSALTHPHWWWLALATASEIGSMVYFARVQRQMLTAGGVQLPFRRAVAVTFAANAMSVTLPAGPVISTAYTFRRLRAWGASSTVVTWGMVASGLLSTVTLTVLGAFGATLAGGDPDLLLLAGEALLLVFAGLGARQLAHRPDLILRFGEFSTRLVNRLLRRPAQAGQERIHQLLDELLVIHPRVRDWAMGLLFASLNWLLDLLCLVAACRAVGVSGLTLAVVLLAYVGGMAASSLPLIPGGVGVVDGALLLALTHGGIPLADATAAVVLYRLISFVMVAAIGWVFWFALRGRPTRG